MQISKQEIMSIGGDWRVKQRPSLGLNVMVLSVGRFSFLKQNVRKDLALCGKNAETVSGIWAFADIIV